VSTLGVGYVGDLPSLEKLRLSHCGSLTVSAVRALQKLPKLKELDVDGVRMSTTTYSNLQRSISTARITGRPALYSTYNRTPQHSYVSAKVIIRSDLDNAQKKTYLNKLKQLLDAETVTFYSVVDVAEGTQFEIAPVTDESFKEFAGKIKFGAKTLDAGNRTVTVELTKKPGKTPDSNSDSETGQVPR
jgi:hypothetical protein